MAMRRSELAMRGVLRAVDLPRARNGRRIRVAGTVITRQRPGTAKGFVFLTLEDETGIANIIIRPDLFDRERFTILEQPFLLVDGILQNQDGVTSVKAERLQALAALARRRRLARFPLAAVLHLTSIIFSSEEGLSGSCHETFSSSGDGRVAGRAGIACSRADTGRRTRRIDATVLDAQGLPIVGARVTATLPRGQSQPDGARARRERFTLEGLAPGVYTLRVSAAGFQMQEVVGRSDARRPSQTVEVRLRPGGHHRATRRHADALRTARRRRAGQRQRRDATSRFEQSPAVVADDVLRQVPTFSLFRRTSSIAANPTAQGVSLRGIGPSGVSRTLVLLDDMPVQRSVRRLGVLDARADDERRADRDRRRRDVEPVRQLRDGRRHQHRDEPPVAAHAHFQAAVRQSRDAEDGSVRQRRLGQARASPSTRRRCRPTATRSWRRRGARVDRQRSERPSIRTSAASSITTRPIASTCSSAPASSTRSATTARSASSTTRTGSTAAAACG